MRSDVQSSQYSQQEYSSHFNRRSLFTEHQAVPCLQAESVNELVGARTAAAADSALAGLTGGIGATVQRLRLSALTLLAELEVWVAPKCLLLLCVTACLLWKYLLAPPACLPAMVSCLQPHVSRGCMGGSYTVCWLVFLL